VKQIKAEILKNEGIKPGRFRMGVRAPSICRDAKAGQFVMVKCSKGPLPFLRRPFSFHRIGKDNFEILYQVLGKGTEELSKRRPGEKIDIIGPLGNTFGQLTVISSQHSPILVAGGIGVAPLLQLARELKINNLPITVLLGVVTKSHILCAEDFRKLGAEVHIATEDGSIGHKGRVTEILNDLLNIRRYTLPPTIYACGPREMLKETARVAKTKRVHCEVSLEERMACGTGVCLGCAVKTVLGFKMVCKDGPIFNSGDIIW
jgi:dihydroorotate dehydrogenase electron transfer subunit